MKKLYFSIKEPSINELRNWKTKGKLLTNPDYQRDYVYTEDKASRLVESALMLIPLPTIYLCEEENNVYSVIDGQQRIMSFIKFVDGDFALKGLTSLTELNGKYYKDLDAELQMIIDDTTFRTILIAKESSDAKYDIFERLNRGAVTLKEQELRNCVYRGPYNSMINDLADEKNVATMFKAENKRMWYQEYILRFFALIDFMSYKPSMKTWLNKYMKLHQFEDEKSIAADREKFVKTLSIVKEVLGAEAFATVDYEKKTVINKFSATFYDSIMIAFSKFDRTKLINKADAIRLAIEDKKLHDDVYHDACYAATGSTDRVIRRILTIFNLVSSILGDDGTNKETRTFDPALKLPLAEKQNYICPLCKNKIVDIEQCEIDHILPYSLGGKTTFENAQLVHMICNRHKSNNVNIDEVVAVVDADSTYKMSEDKNVMGKKITMYKFMGKTKLVSRFYDFFASLMDDIKDAIPGKFNELADREFKPTKRSKPYISHTSEGMYGPYEVVPGVFIECCMDNNKMMHFGRMILEEFNINPANVVISFKGREDDEE
jgi:hypothetical protein